MMFLSSTPLLLLASLASLSSAVPDMYVGRRYNSTYGGGMDGMSRSGMGGQGGGAGGGGTTAGGSSTSGVMVASFTSYGTGDMMGSQSCSSPAAACGFYTNPGYSVAVSQNLWDTGACGKCYKVAKQGGPSVVVKVTNECPAAGNVMCSMTGNQKNSAGGKVNFDLCIDSGADQAVLQGSGTSLGTAEEVPCTQWKGKVIKGGYSKRYQRWENPFEGEY